MRVVDLTGMPSVSETWKIYVDTVAPSLILGKPLQEDIYSNNSVRFNFSVQDNMDEELSCELYVGEDLEWAGNVTNSSEEFVNILLVDGNHTYKINCSDEAKNQIVSEEINFTVYAPPIIELFSPSNNTYYSEDTLNFSYVPYDALGLIECSIYLDEVLKDTSYSITENVLNNFSVGGIGEGKHNWSVECSDNDLNIERSNYSFFYRDNTPPEIILEEPYDNKGIYFTGESVKFKWRATDLLDNFMRCDLYVDNQLKVNDKLITDNISTTEFVTGLSFGEHTWNVSCWDSVGNLNFSETRNFNLTYPDFYINSSSLITNSSTLRENELITFNVTV